MSDLRRRALASGKTVSKKAASRLTSATSSQAGSKAGSRVTSAAPSRQVTDDEGWDSEGSVYSMASMGAELTSLEEATPTSGTWEQELADRISRIVDGDRKKLASGGLEEALAAYSRMTMGNYAAEEIEGQSGKIVDACMKIIAKPKTDRECNLAATALIVTTITDPDCFRFTAIYDNIQKQITNHPSLAVKGPLIHALGCITFYGDATSEQLEDVMDFYHEIFESDGHSIGAGDDGAVVTATINQWAFLCTLVDDAEEITDQSMEALIDQLDSAEIDVQVAAGEAIALLFEKGHRERTEDEDESDDDESSDQEIKFRDPDNEGQAPIEKYVVYRDKRKLIQTLTELSRSSSKNVSKRNRRAQHTSFTNVLHTVENPLHGPNYSRALSFEGHELGSRLEIKVGRKGTVKINSWWKLIRWNTLRKFLAGGTLVHWEFNNVVFQSLPLILEAPKEYKKSTKKSERDVVR